MYTLHITHPVPDYATWKSAFDSDPIGRSRMNVRHYRVLRDTSNASIVTIDLDFDSASEAEACLTALRGLWANVQGTVMMDPRVNILEVVEEATL